LCGQEIAESAIKCPHCSGYQGKWFFLNLSTPVLSLLVALVSVLSFSAPLLLNAFAIPKSDVRVVFQYFRDGTAYFVATNPGTRPGSIGEVYFDNGENSERYDLSADPNALYVAPGTSRQLAFRIPCDTKPGPQVEYAEDAKWGSRPLPRTSRVNVIVIQFDGTSQTQSTRIGELSAIQAIADRKSQCLEALFRDAAAGGSPTKKTR
jgi:hypothetical protein